MNREQLKNRLSEIKPLDSKALEMAKERQESLAKPPGSLGRLEDLSVQLAGISGKLINSVEKQAIIVLSSDNGVCEEGVSSAPQTVTMAQTINFTRRLTGVGALSKNFGVDLLVVDMGVIHPIPEGLYTNDPAVAVRESKIWNKKIRKGTSNLFKESAMTEEEALMAIETGIEGALTLANEGYEIIGVGEMGIGNTTTSSCLLSALAGATTEDTVGRGGGITDESFEKKKLVVETAVERLRKRAKFQKSEEIDPILALAEVGGFDIAAMAGAFIGAAIARIPVVIDGYISVVAALVAEKIYQYYKPSKDDGSKLADFMISSHKSFERGYQIAIKELGLEPMLLLGMRLGEGSGCPIAFKVVEAAAAAMRDMATFAEAEIDDDYLEEIRKGDSF